MDDNDTKDCGIQEILRDLGSSDMLELSTDERLWKLYCFYGTDEERRLRHRIYTKLKSDARLALVTFAVHNPPLKEGKRIGAVRSAIARVPDLSASDLERLIEAIREQARGEACEEIDLSDRSSLIEQFAWLEERAT